jgi:hypothetical protein
MILADKYHLDANHDGKIDMNHVLIFTQWLMMVIGSLFNIITFFLFGPICKLVHEELKENIFLHLEGNAFVYENFYQVCYTRGVLKLDYIANLLFFTCIAFLFWSNSPPEGI